MRVCKCWWVYGGLNVYLIARICLLVIFFSACNFELSVTTIIQYKHIITHFNYVKLLFIVNSFF